MDALLARFSALDPALEPGIRAFLVGYAASVGPEVIKLLLGIITGGRKRKDAKLGVLGKLLSLVGKGFAWNGLAVAAAVSIGGAKLGESSVEPLVRKLYLRSLEKHRRRRNRGNVVLTGDYAQKERTRREDKDRIHERKIKILSTFLSSTISSLFAIVLLQSSPAYARRLPPGATTTQKHSYPVQESPSLDLTLFLLVRAVDSLARGGYEATGTRTGKRGIAWHFLGRHTDTLVFSAACWRISQSISAAVNGSRLTSLLAVWCWFYLPSRLPPSYVRWICGLARGDPALMELSRSARRGHFTYGETPSPEVASIVSKVAQTMKLSSLSVACLSSRLHDHLTMIRSDRWIIASTALYCMEL